MAPSSTPVVWCATLEGIRAGSCRPAGSDSHRSSGYESRTNPPGSNILRQLGAAPQKSGGDLPQPGDLIIAVDEMAERSLRPFAARHGRPLHSVQALS